MLRVHPNTVRKWVTRGLLHAYRLGSRGDRRFAPEEVERFLRMNNGRKPPREGD
jgi:excisionase family DNA binding protein